MKAVDAIKCYTVQMIQTYWVTSEWRDIWGLSSLVTCIWQKPEKSLWNSHNALLPVGYFVQVVMWVISDKPCKPKMQDWDNFW